MLTLPYRLWLAIYFDVCVLLVFVFAGVCDLVFECGFGFCMLVGLRVCCV